jgi:predicted dehydrogenase
MQSVRIGVIGLGNMGQGHIKNHLPKVEGLTITAVADADESRLANYDVPGFTSTQALMDSGLVDAVLIATPHYDHTESGIAALQAGLHVLVEKPISVDKADCERLIAAHDGSTQFAAMFNQRTDPRYQRVRELLQTGVVGELQRVHWAITNWFRPAMYYRSGGWRATWAGEGGGVLLNQCPHNIDLYQWMFGVPTRITAVCGFGKFHDIEVEDSVTAIFEHGDRNIAVFETSTGELPGSNRLEIAGDLGRLILEGDELKLDLYPSSNREFSETVQEMFPWRKPESSVETFTGSGGQHTEIIRNFVAAINGQEALLAPAAEGIHSVEMANAMIWSGLTRKAIDLPMDAAGYAEVLAGLKAK